MRRAGLLLLLAAFFGAACPGSSRPLLPAPDGERYAASLRSAGLPATVELVQDPRETPGCAPAETRFRLRLGGSEFVNVSRFTTEHQARACWDDYRDVVGKGGQAAWDRLAPLAVLDGKHLFMFPETVSDPVRRARIIAALHAAE